MGNFCAVFLIILWAPIISEQICIPLITNEAEHNFKCLFAYTGI